MSKKNSFYFILLLATFFLVIPSINQTDYVNSTITSKTLFFIYALLGLLSFYILNLIFNKNKLVSLKISKIDIFVSIIFIFISLNRYFIQSNYGFSIRFIELVGLGLLYTILRGLTSKNFIWLLLAIIVSGSIQAVYGNLQLLGYYASNHAGFALTGSFFNPGPYAGFLTAVWPIAIGMYLFKEHNIRLLQIENKSKIVKRLAAVVFEYIPLIGMASIILVLPATRSRAAWVAVCLSSILIIEYRYSIINKFLRNTNKIKKTILTIVSIVVISSILFGVYHLKKGSSDGRLFIWKVTTEVIKENPLFGVGFDRFKAHYMNSQTNYFVKNGETQEALVADNTYYAFNEWLQYIVENGLIGAVFLGLLLYTLFKIKVKKGDKPMFAILSSGLLAIGCFAFFSYPMQILPIKLILVLILAMLSTIAIKKYEFFKELKPNKPLLVPFKIIIFIVGIISIFKVAHYATVLEQSLKTWKSALNSHQYGDYESAIQAYAKVYPELKKDGDFLMNYGKSLSINKQAKQAVKILEEAKLHLNTTIIETALGDSYKNLKQYDKAERAYQHGANMIPVRFYPMYLLAKLYEENGDKIKAVKMAQNILDKDIKIPSTAIKEIQAEMKIILQRHNNKTD
ncbi:O-antigen ligase family protein [Flavivirga jejuensis]|uniref:O-antigen ligase family protein n=1 Tax=Flavivirga jejuensis TaxID=870487 RepID=A0ABT8WSU8_9FLAO|nr:O-antigen ligase family protein [Flavivirga jejuensis]MDO5975941.1 O-antigen ligase family protein [Flavivirga jejuensis]